MIEIAGGAQRLRPHVKTHKLGPLVKRQIELGITKYKCATIAEAEMCAAGRRARRAAGHAVRRASMRIAMPSWPLKYPATVFSTIADDEETIRFLAAAAQQQRVSLGVYLDLDCGMARTGIVPGEQAVLPRESDQGHTAIAVRRAARLRWPHPR